MKIPGTPWRVDVYRLRHDRWYFKRGGQATSWPWTDVSVPLVGSMIVCRTRPRSSKEDDTDGE